MHENDISMSCGSFALPFDQNLWDGDYAATNFG